MKAGSYIHIFTGGTQISQVGTADDIKVTFIEFGHVSYFLDTWVLSNNRIPYRRGT